MRFYDPRHPSVPNLQAVPRKGGEAHESHEGMGNPSELRLRTTGRSSLDWAIKTAPTARDPRWWRPQRQLQRDDRTIPSSAMSSSRRPPKVIHDQNSPGLGGLSADASTLCAHTGEGRPPSAGTVRGLLAMFVGIAEERRRHHVAPLTSRGRRAAPASCRGASLGDRGRSSSSQTPRISGAGDDRVP